jgi:hypothetical protein
MAADLLTTIRSELDARLSELRPLLAEYQRLVAAVDALEVGASKGKATAAKQMPVRASAPKAKAKLDPATTASASSATAPRRRGRPRGSAAGALKRAASTPPAASAAPERTAPVANAAPERARDDTQAPAVTPSRPAAAGARRRSGAPSAGKTPRAPRGAAKLAIVAALEHGSHTVAELAVVTAMSGPNINGNIRRLLQDGTILKTTREGKTAYALAHSVVEQAS